MKVVTFRETYSSRSSSVATPRAEGGLRPYQPQERTPESRTSATTESSAVQRRQPSQTGSAAEYSEHVFRVKWVTIATTNPMGQQRYESEIQSAIRRVAGPEWSFEAVTVTAARSNIAGARRTSMRLNNMAPLWLSRILGRTLYGKPDLVHRFDLRLPAAWGREVLTVHDLPPLRFPDEGTLTRSAKAGIRRAARVVVPSRFGASEVVDLMGVDAIEIISYGVSADYLTQATATDAELKALGIGVPFLIHAAGATMRKNLAGLAEAWRRLESSHPELTLVLCGPQDPRRDTVFAGLSRVVKTGRLEPQVVTALMRRAAAVVVPSTYEGFGLPALEGAGVRDAGRRACRGARCRRSAAMPSLLVEPDGGCDCPGHRTTFPRSGSSR